MKPYVLLLKPAFQDNIWGGRRLIEEFHMDCPLDRAAEAWVLSCHKDGQSRVINRPLTGVGAVGGGGAHGAGLPRQTRKPILLLPIID